jgi:hypothetical protein
MTASSKILEEITSLKDFLTSKIEDLSAKVDDIYLKVIDLESKMETVNKTVSNIKIPEERVNDAPYNDLPEIPTKPSLLKPAKKTLGDKKAAGGGGGGGGKAIQRGKVIINHYENILLITGDTFDRRDVIKKYGGSWNGDNKGWTVEIGHLDPLMADLKKYCKEVIREEKAESLDVPEKKTYKTSGLKPAALDIDLTGDD